MVPIFETPRLILRQFTELDAPLILDLNSSEDIVKYVHEPLLTTFEEAKHIILNIILPQYENKLGRWAMHLKANNEFIGWCGLKYIKESDEIDLGYRIKKQFWGQGYATEAARETLRYGFEILNIQLITGHAHIENIASIRVLEKIGMQFDREGIVDNYTLKTFTMANPLTK